MGKVMQIKVLDKKELSINCGYNITKDMDALMSATIYAAQGVMDYLIDFFDTAFQS